MDLQQCSHHNSIDTHHQNTRKKNFCDKRIRKFFNSLWIIFILNIFCPSTVFASFSNYSYSGHYTKDASEAYSNTHSHKRYESQIDNIDPKQWSHHTTEKHVCRAYEDHHPRELPRHPLHKTHKKHLPRRSLETFLGYSSSPYCEGYYTTYCTSNIAADIKRDFCVYFRPCNLLMLSTFLVLAGISANTGFDRSVARHWQREIHNNQSDSFFKTFKDIGGLSYWYIPLYLGTAAVGAWRSDTFAGNVLYNWGYRGFRTGLLSIVQQIPIAYMTGSGRPCLHQPSKWQPFKYKTGVSGHTVFGAIPFLTAAYMTDPPLLRFGLIVLSTLPGISRIDSNSHYLSQVIIGWGIAFLSARAVYESDVERASACQYMLEPRCGGAMFKATYQF